MGTMGKQMTQTELARLVGVTQQHISQILAGNKNPGTDVAIKLAGIVPGTDILFWLRSSGAARRRAFNRVGDGDGLHRSSPPKLSGQR